MATGGCVPDTEVNKVTCAVCLEQYRRPKLLPCFHTFCQSCLQAVAGPSPSFPCPACRTPVLLPPGGVAALQTNFYIEQDLGTDSTPTVRLCDVCTEDREATHTCVQCQQRYCLPCRRFHDSITPCRSHTVVSLQPDGQDDGNLKGDASVKDREEFCLKHRNQPVILHCTACKSNICIQCKLTSHEGHPTEDLAETVEKVKAKLQDKLEMMVQQKRSLEGLLSVIEEKRRILQSSRETTEQKIKGRRETLRQYADECQEKALKSLHSLNEEQLTSLNAAEEGVHYKQAAVSAQHDYATRMLLEDKDTDIVSLEGQLKEVTVDYIEVSELLNSLENDTFTCKYDPLAIITAQEYIGTLKRSRSEPNTDCSAVLGSPLPHAASAVAVAPAKKSVSVTKVFYSRNPKSKIVAMCSTSKKRVWIKYKPSGEGVMMGLFNKEGMLESRDDVIDGTQFVTVLNDVTIGTAKWKKISWIQVDGTTGTAETDFSLCSFPKYGNINLFAKVCSNRFEICRCFVPSMDTSTWKRDTRLLDVNVNTTILDVSPSAKHFALKDTTDTMWLDLYLNQKSAGLRHISSYTPGQGQKQKVLDACFFPLNSKEFLLVVVKGDNKIHVVDHTDGCHLVRYLDTGSVNLDRPRYLATDQDKVLWIGSHGGKLVLLEI